MADRSHLSIGEVLSLLQDDFPDVTISKIRFLESQGLLDPERTPSGYRKFYEADIERLRWILRHQRDHFLPLKVIKDRLEESSAKGLTVPPDEPTAGEGVGSQSLFDEGSPTSSEPVPPAPTASARPETGSEAGSDYQPIPVPERAVRPVPPSPLPASSAPAAPRAEPTPPPPPPPPPSRPEPAVPAAAARPRPASPVTALRPTTEAARPAPRPVAPVPPATAATSNPLDPGPSTASFTLDELASASGLDPDQLADLVKFNLINGRKVGGDTFYDADELVVARMASGFVQFGIEARHLRMYKVAADREAGFIEQVVMPLLKQRNPTARRQAADNLGELARLGEQLRSALLRGALRDHTDLR